jgi:iron(II)-dependent oxidoreductase
MRTNKRSLLLGVAASVALVLVCLGWLLDNSTTVAAGAAALVCAMWLQSRVPRRAPKETPKPPPSEAKPVLQRPARPVDPSDTNALVEQMLAQGRYAILLRSQIARNLSEQQFAEAREALQAGMALVPNGEVVLGEIDEHPQGGDLEVEETAASAGRVIRVEHFFLDRYPVTNRQFYEFVAGGGYEQISLWEAKIWPAVLDFVDQTGEPGPRFWKQGCYEPGLEDHPVVGVSWYEAAAYAQWLGKRLPTDAEWVKAGSWPVNLSPTTRVQRKYPWGDTMDRARTNLWGSGPGRTVPVDRFPEGVSVGGVYQLIGNVWEWTRADVHPGEGYFKDVVLEVPMKSIRGGAFDSYFDNQATCQFQSGEVPMARKRNVGFRCAVGVCDLVLSRSGTDHAAPPECERPAAEEVPV